MPHPILRCTGRVMRVLEVGPYIVSDVFYRTGTLLARHAHADPYVSLVLDGAYTELCDGIPQACRTGTTIAHRCGEHHADYFAESGRCVNIEPANDRYPFPMRRTSRIAPCGDSRVRTIVEALGRPPSHADERSLVEAISGIVHEDVPEEAPSQAPPPAWLSALVREFPWLESEPLGRVAQTAGVHPVHFSKVFRRHFGIGAAHYRLHVRIRHAASRLIESGDSLARIAHSSGFSDQSHFSNAFKAAAGLAPGTFRRAFGG